MSPRELRASLSLAAIFGLRLFGMFVILPVFALWADGRPGWNLTLVGIALGVYGLTQAILQIPFGYALGPRGPQARALRRASRSWPRAASSRPPPSRPWTGDPGAHAPGRGRHLRRGHRDGGRPHARRASAPRRWRSSARRSARPSRCRSSRPRSSQQAIGVPGIFAMTGVLCIAAMARGRAGSSPTCRTCRARPRRRGPARGAARTPSCVRLNVGIFVLRVVLMAVFVVVPAGAGARRACPRRSHWWVYLGVVGGGFVLMLPAVMGRAARARAHRRPRRHRGAGAARLAALAREPGEPRRDRRRARHLLRRLQRS